MIQKWFRRSLLLIVTLLFSFVLSVSAQGGPLAYGDLVSNTLTPGTPVIHTFAGNPNDLATVYLLTGTQTNVTVSVSNSSGIPLGFSNGDPLTPMPNDARVTALLPSADVYIVTLNNTGDTATSYTLSLTGAQLPPAIPVAGTAPVDITPQGAAQVLSIPATTISQTINLQGISPSSFSAQLFAPDGSVLATVAGGLEAITFSAPAGTGNYTLIIDAVDPTLGTQVNVNILSGGAPPPASTEEASAPPATDPNVCTVIPSVEGGVNVRSGPGTNYPVIGALPANGTLVVTGQNSGWYTGNYNGQNGWVASSVVTAVGNCNNLQTVTAPPPPQPTTAPPTATTSTDTNTTNPTATTSAPTATTATPTATEEQVAFVVVSMTCRYVFNDGAYIDYRVEGPPGAQFQLEVRQGSTVYTETWTMNDQGFRTGNEEVGSVGNSNYTGYIVYNGVDFASDPCD